MRNLSIKALKSMWMPVNSGPFVVPIQSSCPHDLGQQVEFCAFQDSYLLRIILRLQHVWWKFWENGWTWAMLLHYSDVSKHFSWKKKTTWDTLLVVWNHVVRTLDKLQLKEARRWGIFSDKSLVVCTRSSLPVGPDFGGLLTVGIVVLLAWGNGWWWKIAVIFCSFSFGGIWALEWRPV